MADVTGPIRTLAGSSHTLPEGTKCDMHPNLLASHRIQGETDSMGSEMHDMCSMCYEEYKAEVANADTSGICDWCKCHSPSLRDRRDYEEGMCGRVYQVCQGCIDKENARYAEEAEEYDDYVEYWPGDEYDD